MCVGMAADPVAAARIKRTGLGIIHPSIGIQAMAALLGAMHSNAALMTHSLISAVPVDWQHIFKNRTATVPFFLHDFAQQSQPVITPAKTPQAHKRVRPQVRSIQESGTVSSFSEQFHWCVTLTCQWQSAFYTLPELRHVDWRAAVLIRLSTCSPAPIIQMSYSSVEADIRLPRHEVCV